MPVGAHHAIVPPPGRRADRVQVCASDGLETPLRLAQEVGSVVSADVSEGFVDRTEERRMRGHDQEEDAARAEEVRGTIEQADIVGHVLKDVDADGRVEGRRIEGGRPNIEKVPLDDLDVVAAVEAMAKVRRAEGVLVDGRYLVALVQEVLRDRADPPSDLEEASTGGEVRRGEPHEPTRVVVGLGHPPQVVERVDDLGGREGLGCPRHGRECIIPLVEDLAERMAILLSSPGGPLAALEALPSVRGSSRGEGEGMDLLAIDGAVTRLLGEAAERGGPAAAAAEAERVIEALEAAAARADKV